MGLMQNRRQEVTCLGRYDECLEIRLLKWLVHAKVEVEVQVKSFWAMELPPQDFKYA